MLLCHPKCRRTAAAPIRVGVVCAKVRIRGVLFVDDGYCTLLYCFLYEEVVVFFGLTSSSTSPGEGNEHPFCNLVAHKIQKK